MEKLSGGFETKFPEQNQRSMRFVLRIGQLGKEAKERDRIEDQEIISLKEGGDGRYVGCIKVQKNNLPKEEEDFTIEDLQYVRAFARKTGLHRYVFYPL